MIIWTLGRARHKWSRRIASSCLPRVPLVPLCWVALPLLFCILVLVWLFLFGIFWWLLFSALDIFCFFLAVASSFVFFEYVFVPALGSFFYSIQIIIFCQRPANRLGWPCFVWCLLMAFFWALDLFSFVSMLTFVFEIRNWRLVLARSNDNCWKWRVTGMENVQGWWAPSHICWQWLRQQEQIKRPWASCSCDSDKIWRRRLDSSGAISDIAYWECCHNVECNWLWGAHQGKKAERGEMQKKVFIHIIANDKSVTSGLRAWHYITYWRLLLYVENSKWQEVKVTYVVKQDESCFKQVGTSNAPAFP